LSCEGRALSSCSLTSACKPLTSTSLSSISLPNKFVKATHLLAWRSCLLTSSHNSMSSALMNNDGEAIVHEQVVESVDYEAMPVAKARTLSRRSKQRWPLIF
ncbi:hypothetical protein Vretimale_5590, partial [Volvox reticuliferus]